MKRKKLLEIADMLDKFRETTTRHFSMMSFWSDYNRGTSCGTSCCAIGWAIKKKILPKTWKFDGLRWPYYKHLEGWEAIQEYFGLSVSDANHLFLEKGSMEKPKTVAKRIREFVKEKR